MLTVALTGGIASGKSVIAEVLEELGCYIHNADLVAREFMDPENPAWEAVVAHFGQEILNPDKTINRSKLGEIVFSDDKERLFLNNIIHPLVFEKKREIIHTLRKEGDYKIFVSEAALTIEAGFADFFDRIIIASCKKEIQITRLMERDQISHKDALKKIQSQMDPKKKAQFADYRIDTSGRIQNTIEQTEIVFRNLMMDYQLLYGS
ncbi:MAG: dephospho-CoA kinase [Candidatus Aminicenantaceae bacterium]|jgi:dephospho-CoA kinase